MRTPLQGVKHTLGTTTRDRAAVRSTATKAPVGCCLVPRVAAPSIRACLGRLAFLRIVSCAERIRVGEADNPKAAGSNPKSWRFPPVRREDLLTAFWGSANQKSLRDGRRPTAADAASRHDPFP